MTRHTEAIATTAEQLRECCAELAQCSCFGFDTEFVGEKTYHPTLCLVQVSTPDKLWLIDPLTVGSLDALWELVVDPSRVVVVHAGREESRLCQVWSGERPHNLFDLQIAAGLVGYGFPLGHGPLIQQVLKKRVSKAETLTEWRERPLTPDQIRYAFDDVRYLLQLYERLHGRLKEAGRLEWLAEECDRLTIVATADHQEIEKFRKVKGAGGLDRKRLNLLRALHHWREEKANSKNCPPRSLVRDDLLIEIVKRNPKHEGNLRVVRGLAHRYLEEIIAVIESARAVPREEWPTAISRDQDSPQCVMITQVLCAVMADWAARRDIASGLIASNQDVRMIVRAKLKRKPLPENCSLTRGWRAEHVLPVLLEMLEGKRRLQIHNLRSETPFLIDRAPEEPG